MFKYRVKYPTLCSVFENVYLNPEGNTQEKPVLAQRARTYSYAIHVHFLKYQD